MLSFWESGSHFRKILLVLSFLDTLSTRVGNSQGSNQGIISALTTVIFRGFKSVDLPTVLLVNSNI
jgi:hypothetical protein